MATELGNALAQRGCKVHFITYNQPVRLNVLDPNIYYHEVNVHDYPLFEYQPYELALSSKMVDTVINEKLDLLHVHYAIPHAYAAFMARQILKDKGIEIPVVTTLHGTDITLVGKNPSYKHAVEFSINHSSAITTVSESLKDETYQHFDCGHREIDVIPNFIELSLYEGDKQCTRASLAADNQKIITHISNFRPVKRTEDVIRVFYGIWKSMPAKLILVGDGPERDKAIQQARDLGLGKDVIYLGKTTEVERILCMSDLFLLLSETESFGLAALEAMAAKVPVISSNAGGIPEVNIHNQTGFLSAVGDVESMTKHAIDLLSNPEKHAQFKANARLQAENFDIERILPMYVAVYDRVMGK